MRRGEVIIVALSILVTSCAAESPSSAGPASPSATPGPASPTPTPRPVPPIDRTFASRDCAAPEAAQFDFWVGEWDVDVTSANGAQVTGIQTITRDGCQIFEHFDAPLGGRQGYIGESVSQWVPSLGKWQQRYQDNNGFSATYTGVFESGEMVLYQSTGSGEDLRQSRLVWKEIEPGSLLWHNEVTRDGGKSYAANIVIRYTRRL